MKDGTFTAGHLLALYDRVAEAEDAIPRLRRFVLDLAVRGKLVQQDPSDEPAAELLKWIAKEKAEALKRGSGRRSSIAVESSETAFPFSIPETWQWIPATFPAVGISDLGKKIQTKDVKETGAFPVVDQGKIAVRGFCDDADKVIKVEVPLILFGDHTRETKYIDFDFVVGADGVKLLQPIGIYDRYYFLSLQWLPLESRGYGRHFKMLKASQIPLPPLAEQQRIVAKVDELMALCDRLQAARVGREAVRDRLTGATWARLTAPKTDAETFQSHAHFALQSLPTLTTRPDQIKTLRQTILNLAVRGKLVAQVPTDEPAAELLKRIAKERAARLAGGRAQLMMELEAVAEHEQDFDLPKEWIWTRLGSVIKLWNGFAFKSSDFKATGIPVIRIGDLSDGEVKLSSSVHVSSDVAASVSDEVWIPEDALLLAMSGATTGKTAFNRTGIKLLLNQRVGRIECFSMNINFIRLFFETIIARNLSISLGTAIPNLSTKQIYETAIPLPPLAEQHRIVAKVDALMALCDQLEASLTTATTTRSRLLEALLHEALGGALGDQTEAAA